MSLKWPAAFDDNPDRPQPTHRSAIRRCPTPASSHDPEQLDGEAIISQAWAQLKRQSSRRHLRGLPKTFTLTDFDSTGVNFEVTNLVERYRVLEHGGETSYLRAMLAALREDDVLFDIGANIGMVALHAARRCRTIAFEPDPSFLARLRRNAQLNPDITVQVLPIAVSDSDGRVVLYTDGADGNSPSLVHQRNEKFEVEVEARSLDSLLEVGDLPGPTVIKLDIEGAEILALRGAHNLLHNDNAPRSLFLEVHDSFLPAFGSSADAVLQLVRDAGYTEVRYCADRHDQQHLILDRQ